MTDLVRPFNWSERSTEQSLASSGWLLAKSKFRERIESFDHVVSAMTHDSSTLAGNSGSAIVECGNR
jgi:hypothetical protein